jgi:hypothetical protein
MTLQDRATENDGDNEAAVARRAQTMRRTLAMTALSSG